jgi:ketosteroid isomerase-like protein
MTPKELLASYVEGFNVGDVNSLIMMYEADACFVSQPGHIINGLENIRQGLQGFIDMNGKLDTRVKGVIQTSDIALVNTEWSFNGTGPDGKAVTITGKATDVLRQQPDRTWRILIDNPWGTDIQTAYEKN